MVIGLLAITAIPTVTGVGQAISAQKKQNAAAKEQVKFHMEAMMLDDASGQWKDVASVVLADQKVLLDMPGDPAPGHPFCGWYFKYPGDEGHLGLVSSIAVDPPMLNWIYADAGTGQLRHGGRKDTIGHVIGPWGWSRDETLLVLKGEDGYGSFVARRGDCEEEDGDGEGDGDGGGGDTRWRVYWDPEGKVEGARPVRLRRRMQLGIDSSYVRN